MTQRPGERHGKGASATADVSDLTPSFPQRDAFVLFVAPYHYGGQPHRGLSFEYQNMFLCLQRLVARSELYDPPARIADIGRRAMNRELADLVRRERPDVTIVPLMKDELVPALVDSWRDHTTTVAYFFDDDWRRDYAESWAGHFDFFTTPRTFTFRRWRSLGYDNVIYSPFGYNHYAYTPDTAAAGGGGGARSTLDISFVGGYHPYRAWLIRRLRRAGMEVHAWGNAWPAGVIDQTGMVETFGRSRINLNLSDSTQWDLRYVLSSHRAVRNILASDKDREQIKARHFEIPGGRGFQLTYYAEDLERMFEIGREVAVYTGPEDLVDKARHYLDNPDERAAVAQAGYVRAASEHTMAHRFVDLLDRVEGGHGAGSQVRPTPAS